MTYKATFGTTSTVITIVISLLLCLLFAFLLYGAISASEILLSIIFALVIMGISTLYLFAYLYQPVCYVVDERNITIKRRIKDVMIPIEEIRDAFVVRRESMKWTERVGGNGGLFGFYGNFKNHFGVMTWYATRLTNYVMIETLDTRIVLTPDNTDMIKEIRRLIGK